MIDGTLADQMAFWGQVGHHGSDFIAEAFLKEHKEYEWMRGLLKDMKCGPWSRFEASEEVTISGQATPFYVWADRCSTHCRSTLTELCCKIADSFETL